MENCRFYNILSPGHIVCRHCNFGYTGVISEFGFEEKCVDMTKVKNPCNINKRYKSLTNRYS